MTVDYVLLVLWCAKKNEGGGEKKALLREQFGRFYCYNNRGADGLSASSVKTIVLNGV
jgi:hypothetical protein